MVKVKIVYGTVEIRINGMELTLGGPFGPFLGVVDVVVGCGMTGLDGTQMWVWCPGQKMGSPRYAGYLGFDGNRFRVYGLIILVGHVMQ